MSDLTRRTVVGAGATGVALTLVSAVPPATAAAGTVARPPFSAKAALYRRARFTGHRGAIFRLTGPGARATARLVAVTDLSSGGTRGSTRSFEVTFRTSRRGPEQGTYTLARTGFAATALFLVPTDDSRRTYRAVVNNR